MSPKISVIIPVFNSAEYLETCFSCLRNQTLKEFETIFVNDGSNDNSLELLNSLRLSLPNCIVINQKENRGQAAARNLALKSAKGNYIAFLDSDDEFAENYLHEMFNSIQANNSDLAICQIAYCDTAGFIHKIHSNEEKQVASSLKAVKSLLLCDETLPSVCNKLFSRKFFEKFMFEEGVYYEDLILMAQVFSICQKINIVEKPLYFYVQRANSTMHSITSRHIRDRINAFRKIYEYFSNSGDFEKIKKEFTVGFMLVAVLAPLTDSLRYDSPTEVILNEICKDRMVIEIFTLNAIFGVIQNRPIKGLALLMLKINPQLFIFASKLYVKCWDPKSRVNS